MIKVPRDLSESEKSIYLAAYNRCNEIWETSDTNNTNINTVIDQVVDIFEIMISDPIRLKNFLLEEVSIDTEPILSVVAEELQGSDWWDNLNKSTDFIPEFWSRYFNYLLDKDNWSLSAVKDINDATDDVMNVMANPQISDEQERIGLVFGYVQSGKTAHYIGLLNKAIDAGYKIIIVLSGIHNNLRSQTQSRIDEEVLGYETSLEMQGLFLHVKNAIGVGIGKNNQINGTMVQSLTTRDEKGDFNSKVAGTSIYPPFVIITKKNATILRRIIAYFQKSPFAETSSIMKKFIPSDYPALIIDDEADQASLNTNECYDDFGKLLDDFNPTTINGLIRKLLKLFKSRSYVGYTATPFANIFIPPHITSEEYGNDLYPRDFILRIPRADKYIGAREFFGLTGEEEAPAMPLCRDILNGAGYLSKGTKQTDPVGELPEELRQAIKTFIISAAIRNCRGQRNRPNTMLVHIVRFVRQQNIIKRKVEKHYREEIENLVNYNDPAIEAEFKDIWLTDHCVITQEMKRDFPKYMHGIVDLDWDEIYFEIKRLVSAKEITIYSVNGKSTDSLMYKTYQGKAFNVIVIGGDKLSRGLTLEGLMVSYFTRSSNTYDTLMQMGRWFGYRPGYLDLCRLYTTNTLRGYFLDISMASEELVHQFDFMTDMRQTPMTFGLRVATHPDLLISSRNKIRTGREMKKDFSNHLSQTRSFDVDPEQFDRNFLAVESFLSAIGSTMDTKAYWKEKNREQIGKHFFWMDVSGYDVANFLSEYETSKNATRANSAYMADYIKNQMKYGGAKNWTVCLINVGEKNGMFNIAGLTVGSGIEREKGFTDNGDTCSIHTITSEGHEYLDYTKEQMTEVGNIKLSAHTGEEKTIAEKIRRMTRPRENGLLILYAIGKVKPLTLAQSHHKNPFGFAIVFPHRQNIGDLKSYRVTDIGLEKENYELFE